MDWNNSKTNDDMLKPIRVVSQNLENGPFLFTMLSPWPKVYLPLFSSLYFFNVHPCLKSYFTYLFLWLKPYFLNPFLETIVPQFSSSIETLFPVLYCYGSHPLAALSMGRSSTIVESNDSHWSKTSNNDTESFCFSRLRTQLRTS